MLQNISMRLVLIGSVLSASLSKMTENEKSLWSQIKELQYQNGFLINRVKELEQRLETRASTYVLIISSFAKFSPHMLAKISEADCS